VTTSLRIRPPFAVADDESLRPAADLQAVGEAPERRLLRYPRGCHAAGQQGKPT
jgi:hypothetical protein